MARRYGWGRSYNSERYSGYGRWAPYVPVAQRRAQAAASAKALEKELGRSLSPVKIEGRTIAKSFWGQAWCNNLEAYSDFANRLPRGRTYIRNGSVIDLAIAQGAITAMVSGSEVYRVKLSIAKLPAAGWKAIQRDCARSITSLIDLLQGRFDKGVMQRLTQLDGGLFPKPHEIKMQCSCPDYAALCKHVAAVLYGVGARLDSSPELLFALRHVDHLELISRAVAADNLDSALAGDAGEALESGDLGEMFGIELETSSGTSTRAVSDRAANVDSRKSARKPRLTGAKARRSPEKPVKSRQRRSGQSAAPVSSDVKTAGKRAHRKSHATVAAARSAESQTLARATKTALRRRAAK